MKLYGSIIKESETSLDLSIGGEIVRLSKAQFHFLAKSEVSAVIEFIEDLSVNKKCINCEYYGHYYSERQPWPECRLLGVRLGYAGPEIVCPKMISY